MISEALYREEAALILACQQGDQRAFKVLYDKYLARTYSLVRRLAADEGEAEEITQEVFIRLWRKIGDFNGESQFSTWLHRLASTVALNHIRKRKSWWRRLVSDFVTTDGEYSDSVATSSVVTNTAAHASGQPVEARELEDLDSLICKLPEQARLVFVLFAVEGYRHGEIAKLLGIALGSSKAQYFRARKLLAEGLNEQNN
ncbi:MAG: RNA polymerase subunit sigma-70 [Alteromonadaceae bacterium]|nr:MAG: RNA polymerase subunit sigma-70 [Alteromonadaceae bacterium]